MDARAHGDQKPRLKRFIKRSAYAYRVDCGGCNGCEIELFATFSPLYDPERFGIILVPTPRHADILIFTGPMTRAMRVPAQRAYQAAPDPKLVVAYGACACTGGIFHGSYATWDGTESLFPVDLYVPGCPPTPAATLHALGLALDLLQQKLPSDHFTEEKGTSVAAHRSPIRKGAPVQIEQAARRMAGYVQGRRIAAKYFDLVSTAGPGAADARLDQFIRSQKDPRLAEIYLALHKIYTPTVTVAGPREGEGSHDEAAGGGDRE